MKTISLIFVWLVGLRDYALTRWMIDSEGPQAELNVVARLIAQHFGTTALLPYKLTLLIVFSAVVLTLHYRKRSTGQTISHVGLISHACLGVWWNVVLFTAPIVGGEQCIVLV